MLLLGGWGADFCSIEPGWVCQYRQGSMVSTSGWRLLHFNHWVNTTGIFYLDNFAVGKKMRIFTVVVIHCNALSLIADAEASTEIQNVWWLLNVEYCSMISPNWFTQYSGTLRKNTLDYTHYVGASFIHLNETEFPRSTFGIKMKSYSKTLLHIIWVLSLSIKPTMKMNHAKTVFFSNRGLIYTYNRVRCQSSKMVDWNVLFWTVVGRLNFWMLLYIFF